LNPRGRAANLVSVPFTALTHWRSILRQGALQAGAAGLITGLIVLLPEDRVRAGQLDPAWAAEDMRFTQIDAAVGAWNPPGLPSPTTTPPPGDGHDHDQEGAVLPPPLVVPQNQPTPVSPFVLPLGRWDAVTDRFGAPRGEDLIHGGIDLALDSYPSSAILAACTGTVSVVDAVSSYGNYVMVDCGAGWTTLYGHLSQTLVAKGDRVAAGAILGASGSTGFSTGEHLHFEFRYLGVPLNPEHYLDFKIDPNAPLSSGPIIIPGTSTPTPTPTADGTETTTPTPGTPSPEATATPTEEPTPEPELRDYFEAIVMAGEPAAKGNRILLPLDDEEAPTSRVILAVNQFEGGASAPPAEVLLTPDLGGANVGILVQVNLFVGQGEESETLPVAKIDRAACEDDAGCEGLAYVLRIDVSLASANEVTAPRMQEFLAALATELRLLGSEIDAGKLYRAAIEARLGAVLAAFPEYAGSVTPVADVQPEGAFPPPPEPETTLTPTP
jgi:hypothetical protein